MPEGYISISTVFVAQLCGFCTPFHVMILSIVAAFRVPLEDHSGPITAPIFLAPLPL